MRTIAHISDVHFGRADAEVVRCLVETINDLAPELIVVSGDLTQRARTRQFAEARAFLDLLPAPKIVVPGNHDVPLYNIFSRFINPLEKFKRYITGDLQPFYSDDEIAVVGLNTARSLTIKGGRINQRQIETARQKLCSVDDARIKMIVTHHPFDLPEGFDDNDIVGRAHEAMTGIAECGADVFLAGHLHVSHIGHSARRYRLPNGYSALIVQAGTAASTRVRGEVNSFNVLDVRHPELTVRRFEWSPANSRFSAAAEEQFAQAAGGWSRV